MRKPFISLCMIVKNEEACLPRALADWRKLADELIIVDTGSVDHTVEIAQAHDAQVLHYEWVAPGNKGEARDVGLDAARGQWIVVLDADEIIKDPVGLRHFLKHVDPDVTGVNVQFENYNNDALTLRWYQVRVFRRGLYHYIHREHELPHWAASTGEAKEVVLQTIFEHRAPTGREPGKMQPMIDRLTLDVQENPEDPGPLYFLHRQYLNNNQYQESIDLGLRYIALKCIIDPCEAYGNISIAYHLLGDTQEAIRWLHKAAAEQAHRRIWWIRLAELHMTQGRWQLALAHLRLASELWPTFEWQTEPSTCESQLYALIDKCQRILQDLHHVH